MAGVTCLEFIPPKRGEDAVIEIWEGDHLTGRVEIGADNVAWWRHLFAQGLGLCEAIDPIGVEVVMPTVHTREDTEDPIEQARRRLG